MPQFTDLELEALADSINLYAEALRQKGIKIPDKTRREVWQLSLRHHAVHLAKLRIRQISVDPYKIISWFSFFLADLLDPKTTNLRDVMNPAITTLNYCLHSESPKGGLDPSTLAYLEDFAINELGGDKEFGIGMNGLFVGFHTASVMKRKSVESFRIGWAEGASGKTPSVGEK